MRIKAALGLLLGACLSTVPLSAATVSYTGQFETDDQVQLFNFMLNAGGNVELRSLGYGGGVNAAAATIPAGGFDSLFTVFEGDGTQIGYFDDDPGCAHSKPLFGGCSDAYYSAFLPGGSYVLALTESGNFPNGDLIDGFGQQGNGNFTCPQGFCDVFGNQENGKWAVDMAGVDGFAAVPEPAAPILAATGLLCIGWVRARKARSRNSGAKE